MCVREFCKEFLTNKSKNCVLLCDCGKWLCTRLCRTQNHLCFYFEMDGKCWKVLGGDGTRLDEKFLSDHVFEMGFHYVSRAGPKLTM
jgi:hypothetical protein